VGYIHKRWVWFLLWNLMYPVPIPSRKKHERMYMRNLYDSTSWEWFGVQSYIV
jgi:hypothetical protein